MGYSTVNYGLIKDTSAIVVQGDIHYRTNIAISFDGMTTPSLFLPLINSPTVMYMIGDVMYEVKTPVIAGDIMLIPAGVQFIQFPVIMYGSLLVTDPSGRGRVQLV